MNVELLVFAGAVAFLWWLSRRSLQKRQLVFIDAYNFPEKVSRQLLAKHPHLKEEELGLVFQGLRDYFYICNRAGRKMVSMPSQVVDDAWHEFILFTRKYDFFCKKALGRFLHHTPAEAMTRPTEAQEGIKRAWYHACKKEGIAPGNPGKLPLLFALDAMLEIENGFHYALDCKNGNNGYCAGDIGCGGTGCSSCAGDSGCGGGCGGD